ncbi:MAG: DUF2203 domain-containing protein [Calditrichia bacterium]
MIPDRSFKKYFTLAEAQAALPLVKSIVRDILAEGKKVMQRRTGFISEQVERKDLIEQINTTEQYIEELESLGCFYKDWNFEIGLVDFPGILNDQEIFWCWKSDEDEIRYYHGIEEGYAGRKLVPEELLNEKNPANNTD